MNKKPRGKSISFTTKEKISRVGFGPSGISLYLPSGELFVPDNTTASVTYNGENRKKVISSAPNSFTTDMVEYLLPFNVVFAIDTNTDIIGVENISVASIYCATVNKTSEDIAEVLYRKSHNFIFKNCQREIAEKFSWYLLVNETILHPQYDKDHCIALISDHDFGNHARFNKQDIPIYKDFYLPTNLNLIYATSDKNENLLNKLINECDKDANRIMLEIKQNGSFETIDGQVITINNIKEYQSTK